MHVHAVAFFLKFLLFFLVFFLFPGGLYFQHCFQSLCGAGGPGPHSFIAVLRIRIRIHRIHRFLGLLDPDPLVRGVDPDPDLDPSITKQK
jgi:hypothetical protein